MTDSTYIHHILIVDRSGSMSLIKNDTQGGVRAYAETQATLPGRQTLSLYQFDDKFETVTFFGALSSVKNYQLSPRGMTALYGAIGTAITNEGEKLSFMPEEDRPGKVIVVIATDGEENHSHREEWSRQYASAEKISQMITHQHETYGWEFTYIGANQDSFAQAGKIGVAAAATMDYAATHGGTQSAWQGASGAALRFSSGASASMAYTDSERDDAKDEK